MKVPPFDPVAVCRQAHQRLPSRPFIRWSFDDPLCAGYGEYHVYNDDTSTETHGYAAERCGHYTYVVCGIRSRIVPAVPAHF